MELLVRYLDRSNSFSSDITQDLIKEESLRDDLRYYFMSPCEKYRTRRHIPWKMGVQILKIVMITTQTTHFFDGYFLQWPVESADPVENEINIINVQLPNLLQLCDCPVDMEQNLRGMFPTPCLIDNMKTKAVLKADKLSNSVLKSSSCLVSTTSWWLPTRRKPPWP
ncbi:hypothetical protein ATANTOWER_001749 [Ataeniobius toweri]|uniref:Uncharacterized protein n=1 Tax=Ataeniobius toweri TaxID=208326 RepID=A0ABU7BLN7_9TELE|nr:hypothetical protein [Ataeniobius toweri]